MGASLFPSASSLLPSSFRSSIIGFLPTVQYRSPQDFSNNFVSRRIVKASSSVTGDSLLPSIPAKGFVDKEVNTTVASGEQGEGDEKVMIYTDRSSRTAKLLCEGPEYVSERYVKGSVKYQIELQQSFRLGIPNAEEEVEGEDARADAESPSGSSGDSDGTDEVSTSGKEEEEMWSSETYLRQLLMQRRRSKQVVLNVPTEDTPVRSQSAVLAKRFQSRELGHRDSSDSVDKSDFLFGAVKEDKPVDEDELLLKRALRKKRAIAEETLDSAIRAGGLGPSFCREVMARLSPFVDRILTETVYLKKFPAYKLFSFNSRARLYVDHCRVVDLIKWLKHQGLTARRIGSLICLADERLERIRPRIEVLKSIHVKAKELGVTMEREPSILNQSLAELQKTVHILETAGIERKWLGLIVSRSPRVFSVGNDELLHKISMFTDLGLSPEEFGLVVFKFPAVLGHLSVEEMLSKVDYLRQIGLEDDVLQKMIVSTPQLLACSIEESWDKLLRYFHYLRIEISGIRRILGVHPEVFCLNLEDNIAPKVRFLRAIGVDEEVIGQVIVSFPAILTYSLNKKIRPVVRFLLEGAGVAEADIGKVIALKPELIGCSLDEKLVVIVKWFGSHRLPPRLLGGMIANFPALLMYSIPTLHPKIRYFKRVMKRPLDDIIAFPRYFSYSLKTRIIPRHELLLKKGLTFSLKHMLACSDETFTLRVAAAESRCKDPGTLLEEVPSSVDWQQDLTVSNDEIQEMSVVS